MKEHRSFPKYVIYYQFEKGGKWTEYHARSGGQKKRLLARPEKMGWELWGMVVYKRKKYAETIGGAYCTMKP